MEAVSYETLKKARAWARREFNKRQKNSYGHPSFLVREVLEEADRKFNLGSFGVEGWSNRSGSGGVEYLNMGDPYDTTIYVRTTPWSARFSVGCWGDIA